MEDTQERFAVSGNGIFLICLDLNTSAAGFIHKKYPFCFHIWSPFTTHINFLGISMRCVHHFFFEGSYNFDKPKKKYKPLLCIPQEEKPLWGWKAKNTSLTCRGFLCIAVCVSCPSSRMWLWHTHKCIMFMFPISFMGFNDASIFMCTRTNSTYYDEWY